MNNLPTSIKVIGWGYTLIGILLVSGVLLITLGVAFLVGIFYALLVPLGVVVGLFATAFILILSFVFIILGQGILRKKRTAWFVTFIIALLTVIRFILGSRIHSRFDGMDLWSIFVIWKLYEHRKLFGI